MDTSHAIFYHEDDYRQIEIVPSENFNELIKQAENVQEFATQHKEGGGYTDLMIREDSGISLKQRRIESGELDEILSELPLNRYTEVTTGIRPGEINSKNTYGYGQNYHGIFFDFESDIVTGIWIVGTPNVEKGLLVQLLNDLGMKWDLLLMDWYTCKLIDLKNREQIKRYFRSV